MMKLVRPLSLALALFAPAAALAAEPLRLDGATTEELSAVEGIDSATADRIVALRQERGHIANVEALRVLGLSEQALDNLRARAVVDFEVQSGAGKSYKTVDDVLSEFANEPDVRAVQAMAMSYSNSNPELVESWLAASRSAYLLPKLNLEWDKTLNYNENYNYITGSSGVDELTAQLDGVDTDNNDAFKVKMEWRLDKLVMSSERIRVINEAQDIVKLRDKVLDEVTRLYFDRRRLQVESLLSPEGDLRGKIKNELRLQELTANLDALTGGSFSAATH